MSGPLLRELHLHAGLPKTGTTFLQHCLALNRERLAAQGFETGPMQHPDGAHHDLAWLLRDEGAEAVADALVTAPGARLLVSSEAFGDLLALPARAEALSRALAPHFDVTVHVVLRRPDLMKESAYAQVARLGRRLGPIRPDPGPPLPEPLRLWDDPDHEVRMRVLETAFGRENLRVAVYRDGAPRDPFDQLLGMMGLPPLEGACRPEGRSNAGLPRRKTMLLAAFEKPDAQKFLLSPAERRAVVERYLDGNRRLVACHAPEDGDALLELPAAASAASTAETAPILRVERVIQ